MRILLVSPHDTNVAALEEATRAVGADVTRGADIEAAIAAAGEGSADLVLVPASEILRVSRGEEQISSWLRHKIMNSLATVLGYSQLLARGIARSPESDQEKLEAIAEHAIQIRDLVHRDPADVQDG